MHDPLVVAFEVRLPIPKRDSHHDYDPNSKSPLRTKKWRICKGPFWTIAGKGWYFNKTIVRVWHREPGGRDSGEVCKQHYSLHTKHEWAPDGEVGKPVYEHFIIWTWKLHVHHWRLQFPMLQSLRRRLLTRCAWCGGPSRKGDPVNVSHQWDKESGKWWKGEQGLFHSDCSIVEHAHRMCLCPWEDRILDNGEYGHCQCCGKFYGYNSNPDWAHAVLADLPKGSRIPPELYKRLKAHWKKKNEEARKN